MGYEKTYPADTAVRADAPACRFLLSKGMYITGLRDPDESPMGVGDGYCWCALSQSQRGPDGALVDRPLCSASGRPCYERPL